MCKELICHKRLDNAGKLEEISSAEGHVGESDKKSEDKLEAVVRQLDDIKNTLNILLEKK